MTDMKQKYMACGVIKDIVGGNGSQDMLTFRASTSSPDRDGDIIEPEGCDYAKYMKNPVFLWAHDWHDKLPIGKGVYVDVVPGSHVDIGVKFDMDDPFAAEVKRKYENGFLNAVSIGFQPIEAEEMLKDGRFSGYHFTKWELLELSGVPIPANADALRLGYKGFMAQKGLEVEVDPDIEDIFEKEVESFATGSEGREEEDRVENPEEKEPEAPSDEEPTIKELVVDMHADMSQLSESIKQLIQLLQPGAAGASGGDNKAEDEGSDYDDDLTKRLNELGISEEQALRMLKGEPAHVDIEKLVQEAITERVAYLSGKSWTVKN